MDSFVQRRSTATSMDHGTWHSPASGRQQPSAVDETLDASPAAVNPSRGTPFRHQEQIGIGAPSIDMSSTRGVPSVVPRDPSAVSSTNGVAVDCSGAAALERRQRVASPGSYPSTDASESVWKQRVRDRDDVVRDLMRRIVELEQENGALKLELDDVVFKQRTAKSTGTNTSHEWVVEQHQRQQLMALEEHMRFQEVCLYAEWFGLSLAFHRQVYHVVRGESQLQHVSEQLNRGLVISTPSTSSASPSRAPNGSVGSRNMPTSSGGRLTHLYGFVEAPAASSLTASPASTSLLKAGIGHHTPSSATGAALHLLRGVDAIQCRYVDRCTQDIVHGIHVINRKNRSLLTAAASVHQAVVSIAYDELEARRALEQAATEGAVAGYQKLLAYQLLHAAERQVQLLSRENKRMLEFAVEESTSHHLLREQLLLEQDGRRQDGLHRERAAVLFQEATQRYAHVVAAEAEARRMLEGVVFASYKREADMAAVLHHHCTHLEGASISMRHGEEPSSRRLLTSVEADARAWLHAAHDCVAHSVRTCSRAMEMRAADALQSDAVQGKALLGASMLLVHAEVLRSVQVDVLGQLDACVAAAVQRAVSEAKGVCVLHNVETHHRLQLERDAAGAWCRLSDAHSIAVVGSAANGFFEAHLTHQRHAYGRDMLGAAHVLRRDVLEVVGGVISTASNLVTDVLLDANGAIVRQQSLHRRTLRMEREEQHQRTALVVQEERDYFHRALLPFVLALRESELNEEYGSMFVNVEDQTRRIMRRATEREAGFLTYFAEEGLIGCHVALGEELMAQQLSLATSFGGFLRDDVQKAERRAAAHHATERQQEAMRVAVAAAAAQEAQRHDAHEHLEHVRRTTNRFWHDVFNTEVDRVRTSWAQFGATELLAWRRTQQDEWARFVGGWLCTFQRFHADAQGGLLGHVMRGPVLSLLAAQQDATIEMCSGVLSSARCFEASHQRADRAAHEHVRELLDLKEIRLKQQVHHGERLYMECRHQLDKEVQLREHERQATWTVLEEEKRRSHLLSAEGYEVLWLVYRALTVQRFLAHTGTGVVWNQPSSTSWGYISGWDGTKQQHEPQPQRQRHPPQQPAYSDAAYRQTPQTSGSALTAYAQQQPPTSPRSPYPGAHAMEVRSNHTSASVPFVVGSASPLTSSALAAAGSTPDAQQPSGASHTHGNGMVVPGYPMVRSESPGSSIVQRSDYMQMEGPNAGGSLARARRSSLVMSRSMERQRAIRGEGNMDAGQQPSSPDARFSDAVASAMSAAGRRTTSHDGATDAFSPSPSTRSYLLAQHERRVQSQLHQI